MQPRVTLGAAMAALKATYFPSAHSNCIARACAARYPHGRPTSNYTITSRKNPNNPYEYNSIEPLKNSRFWSGNLPAKTRKRREVVARQTHVTALCIESAICTQFSSLLRAPSQGRFLGRLAAQSHPGKNGTETRAFFASYLARTLPGDLGLGFRE